MVIQLKPYMADMHPAIWAHLKRHNFRVITDYRMFGTLPRAETLDQIARMIRHYRESKNTNNNTNTKG